MHQLANQNLPQFSEIEVRIQPVIYTLKRAAIDINDIESKELRDFMTEFRARIPEMRSIRPGKDFPEICFEFNAECMDSDYSGYIENSYVSFVVDPKRVRLSSWGGQLWLGAQISFELNLKPRVTRKQLQSWLDNNHGWDACWVSGGWHYSENDGGYIEVVQ